MDVSKLEFKTLTKLLISMAAADEYLDEREVSAIVHILQTIFGLEISRQTIHQIFEDMPSPDPMQIKIYLSELSNCCTDAFKDLIVKSCYLMMVADGKVVDQETKQLSEIAALLKIDENHFVKLIREANKITRNV